MDRGKFMQIPWGNIFRIVLIAILFISICNGIVSAEMTGSLRVIIEPYNVASEAEAGWKLSTGQYQDWYDGGETNWYVPVGKTVLQFSQVPGWCTPPTRTIEISLGENVEYGEYTKDSCVLPEDIYNIKCEEFIKKDISVDTEVMYEFQKDCNIIKNINIKGLRNIDMMPLKIDMLKSTSTTVNHSPPYIIYKNFNIGSANYDFENNLEVISITYSVKKSWIEENDIMSDSISLYGFSEGTWNTNPTEKIDEDFTHIYFTAFPATEQLGTMAVSGQSNKTSISFSPIALQVSSVSKATPLQEYEESKDIKNFMVIGFLLVITILGYFVMSSKSSR